MHPKPFRQRQKIRLTDFRAVRGELCVCYRAWVRDEIDAEALRAASLALTRIAGLDEGQLLEQRVTALENAVAARVEILEARVAAAEQANGHAARP